MRSTSSRCNFIAGAIIELCRTRALICGHSLSIFQRSASLKIRGDAGHAEDVTTELLLEPGLGGAAADHPISVDAVHRLAGERAGSAARGTEEGAFAIVADIGGGEIF